MKLRSVIAAACLALPAMSVAEINYTYVQGTYQVWTEEKVHKWLIKGSYQVNDSLYLTAEDGGIFDFRNASLGFIAPMNNLHLYGQLGLGDSGDGLNPILEGGARLAAGDAMELRGAIRYMPEVYAANGPAPGVTDDEELLFIVEANYFASEKISLVGGLSIPTEADGMILELGARYNF